MRVAIAGAHGQIGTRLGRLLVGRGDQVVGLIRNPEPAADLRAAGAHPVVCDLEHATIDEPPLVAVTSWFFAASAGAGSGAAHGSVDTAGAIKLL